MESGKKENERERKENAQQREEEGKGRGKEALMGKRLPGNTKSNTALRKTAKEGREVSEGATTRSYVAVLVLFIVLIHLAIAIVILSLLWV